MGKRADTPIRDRERLFCHEYLVDLNGAAAAARAGYAESRAKVTASELLAKPAVRALIEELKESRLQRVTADADMVLQDLLEFRSADLRHIYDEYGAIKPIHEWPPFFSRLGVVSIKSKEEFETVDGQRILTGYIREVRWENKTKVLELLGRHIQVNAFREQVSHDVADPLRQLYEALAGRGVRPAEAPGLSSPAPGIATPDSAARRPRTYQPKED